MGEDLAIRLRAEDMPLPDEFFFERKIVLDDSVVDDNQGPRAIAMRMGVLLARPSVGRPAGVPQPATSLERRCLQALNAVADLAFDPPDLDFVIADDGHTRAVIASVFKLLETVQQDGDGVLGSQIADDAAHYFIFFRRTQPGLSTCRPRATAKDSGDTSLVMTDPAPI